MYFILGVEKLNYKRKKKKNGGRGRNRAVKPKSYSSALFLLVFLKASKFIHLFK
jgi:hypothetical protein